MTIHIPVLVWSEAPDVGNISSNLCDSSKDSNYIFELSGTDRGGDRVNASFVIVDNTGINSSVTVDFVSYSFTVSPYTRKTFRLLRDQSVLGISVSAGVVPVTFTDFDPQVPDEVNQVATNSASTSGGGGSSGSTLAVLDPNNKGPDINVSGGNTIAQIITNTLGWQSIRSNVSKTTGKYYFEAMLSGTNIGAGVCDGTQAMTNFLGSTSHSVGYLQGSIYLNGGSAKAMPGNANSTIKVAVDVGGRLFWAAITGQNWNNDGTANPATGTGGIDISTLTGALFIGLSLYDNGSQNTLNTGQNPYQNTPPTGFGNLTQ